MNRLLVGFGAVMVVAGLLWAWLKRIDLFCLPGDIVIDRPGIKFFFPVTTMLILTVVVSVIAWVMRRRPHRRSSRTRGKLCSSSGLLVSQSATQKPMNLGLYWTQVLDELVVDKFADCNLAVERIAPAVLRFGLRRGS